MENIMIDLETMGNTPQSAIIAIGAVEFNIQTREIGDKFYVTVDLESSVSYGGVIDPSTVLWWMKQSDEAREAFSRPGLPINKALEYFSAWVTRNKLPGNLKLWGNGAAFDNVILASAYRNAGLPVPWKFWNDRCYPTVKCLHPDVLVISVGTAHNAVDDAEKQARHLIQMLNPETI